MSGARAFLAAGLGVAAGAGSVENAFEEFVQRYGKVYDSLQAKEAHFKAFEQNLAFVESENAKGLSYKLAINSFADMLVEDFGSHRLGFKAPEHEHKLLGVVAPFLGTDRYSGKDLPDSVDWFVDGAVTAIKDQGSCGSCWTFSTTGALEGAWQVTSGNLVAISEQQLVDCAKEDGLDGCSGGLMDPAFTYLEGHVVCTEDSYPYTQARGNCSEASCTAAIPKGGVVGFKDVPAGDTKALMEAVAQQPVATAVQAGQSAFQMYKSGILTQNCSANVDHAVLIVGYGTENGTEYWKIKNSWGSNWGEDGFIRLERGLAGDGECGVKVMPSYPVVRENELAV